MKSAYELHHVCLSICPNAPTWHLMDRLLWHLILETFMKNCQENPNLNKTGQKYCALYTRIKVCSYCWWPHKILCRVTTIQTEPIAAFPWQQWSFILLTVTCSSVQQRTLASVLPWKCSQYFLYYRQWQTWLNNANKINCCISIAKMVMSTCQSVTYCIQCLSSYILCTTNNYWYGWNFRPNCKCTNRNTIYKFWTILVMTQYT